MDDSSLQILAEHLRDNLGNKLSLSLATGIFSIVSDAVKKQVIPDSPKTEEPQPPA